MTHEQVEHVARAFYEAEYPGEWNEVPEAAQEHFRDLARTAIATLNCQIAAYRSALKPKHVTYLNLAS